MFSYLNRLIIKNKTFFTILFISIILFAFNSKIQIDKFGKTLINKDGTTYNGLVKTPPELNIWEMANDFKNDTSINNLQSYEYRHHFLPPKILGIAAKIFNINFYNKDQLKDLKNLGIFFYFQTIIYYLSVFYFYKSLKKIKLPERVINITVLFLLFEQSINQYSISIFGETIFFSLIIVMFGFIINLPRNNLNYIYFGFLIGIIYLQRSVAMLLILVPTLLIIFEFRKKSIIKLINLYLPFMIILLILGYLNFNRSNVFYVFPTQTIDNLYNYFLPKVLIKSENMTSNDVKKMLKEEKIKIQVDNNLDLNIEKDKIKWYNYQRDIAVNKILNNKILTIEVAIKSSIHSILLNPTELISNRYHGKNYYKSELHKKTLNFRFIYSLLIYLSVLIGFIYCIKNKIYFSNKVFLVGIYFFIVSSWVGYTRYFVPSLLSLCLYFAYGINFLFDKYIIKKL